MKAIKSLFLILLILTTGCDNPDKNPAPSSFNAQGSESAAGLPSTLSFTNVYEFEPTTYRKLTSYNQVNFTFEKPNKATIQLNSNDLMINEELDYSIKKSKDNSITLIRGSKMMDPKTLLKFEMVYDDINNSNGNITITKEMINPSTQKKEFDEKNIRFVNGDDPMQKKMISSTQQQTRMTLVCCCIFKLRLYKRLHYGRQLALCSAWLICNNSILNPLLALHFKSRRLSSWNLVTA